MNHYKMKRLQNLEVAEQQVKNGVHNQLKAPRPPKRKSYVPQAITICISIITVCFLVFIINNTDNKTAIQNNSTFTVSEIPVEPLEIRETYYIATDITWNGDEELLLTEVNFVDNKGNTVNYREHQIAFLVLDTAVDLKPGIYSFEEVENFMEFLPIPLQPNSKTTILLQVIANDSFEQRDDLTIKLVTEIAGEQQVEQVTWQTLNSLSVEAFDFNEQVKNLPLTTEEWTAYQAFKQSKDQLALATLSPLSIAKLYWLSEIEGDEATQYAFYTTKENSVLWSYEEYLTFSPFDTTSLKETLALFEAIATGSFIETAENEGYVSFVYNNRELYFGLLQNDEGIWQVTYMPMQ